MGASTAEKAKQRRTNGPSSTGPDQQRASKRGQGVRERDSAEPTQAAGQDADWVDPPERKNDRIVATG